MCALPIQLRSECNELLHALPGPIPVRLLNRGLQHLSAYVNEAISTLRNHRDLQEPQHYHPIEPIENNTDKNELINRIHEIALKYKEAFENINNLAGEHGQEAFLDLLKVDIRTQIQLIHHLIQRLEDEN